MNFKKRRCVFVASVPLRCRHNISLEMFPLVYAANNNIGIGYDSCYRHIDFSHLLHFYIRHTR